MTTPRTISRLLFIYDANSGTLGAVVDSARKLFRLNGCSLCSITHGLAGEKSEWTSCREELGVPVDLLHRDELSPTLQQLAGDSLPCVVAQTDDGERQILLAPEVLDRCSGSVSDLRGRLLTHASMRDLDLPMS